MVSSVPYDVLADPQRAIQELFSAHDSNHDFAKEVSEWFQNVFKGEDELKLIPPLDIYHPPSSYIDASDASKIVRFRGMVQDTSASPEMYLSRLRGGKYGGWGAHDEYSGSQHIDWSGLKECAKYWVVSVPGESPWVGDEQTAGSSTSSTKSTSSAPHKYPGDSSASHIGLQVKVYHDGEQMLKSTDLVTFIGLLGSDGVLHALFHRYNSTRARYPASNSEVIREELIDWIAEEGLAGDRDAAEWVLLTAIAKVQSRTPPLLPPSLTLSKFPSPSHSPSSPPALLHVLSQVLPLLTHIPLSLPLLNDGNFQPESKPRKDVDPADDAEDELYSGWLQLPRESVCLITEAGVQEGRVNERGIRNVRALQEVLTHQTLEYVFPYSGFRFETDIGCIVCAEGSKGTFLETHVNVPLRPVLSATSLEHDIRARLYKPASEIRLPSPEKLEAFRELIGGAVVRQANYGIGGMVVADLCADYIQDEFVNERKASNTSSKTAPDDNREGAEDRKGSTKEETREKGITAEDLIHRMMVAKLMALSMHEPEVSIDIWKKMRALEGRRIQRLDGIGVRGQSDV